MVTLDFALETVMQLPQIERDYLIEILKKRQSQEWRKETAEYYHDIRKDIYNDTLKPMSVQDVIADLHDYSN
jgi:hypothetical protein